MLSTFSENIKALRKIWMVGDNFTARTYRKYFLERIQRYQEEVIPPSFIKNQFDIHMSCNSKFTSPTTNMLVRIQNSFVAAINKHISLPRYILIILEDDLITFLNFTGPGAADIFGKWIVCLAGKFKEAIADRKKQLPDKAKCEEEPCIYWVAAPLHKYFSHDRNEIRKAFNFALTSSLKETDMRVIKLKKHWEFENRSLVAGDRMTEQGMYQYWEAIDAAFQFNVGKHEFYLAKRHCTQKVVTTNDSCKEDTVNKNARGEKEYSREDSKNQRSVDDMHLFFRRHKNNDRFHWNRQQRNSSHAPNGRFILPKPKFR